MQSKPELYKHYGEYHGTAMYYDCTKPDADAFLDHMAHRLGEHFKDYLDGFIEGKLGDHKRKYRRLSCFAKKGESPCPK